MRRRVVVWFAVVASVLLVASMPASAASVASINTTASDFQAATLDDMSISGSGESASVVGDVGYSELVDHGSSSGPTTAEDPRGLVFSVSSDRGVVFVDSAATGSDDADEMQLKYHGNGTVIETTTFSPDSVVSFEHDFVPGTEYRVTVSQGSDTFTTYSFSPSLPKSSGALSVEHGYFAGESASIYGIEDIATGAAADLSYTGPEHNADAGTLFADVQTSGSTTVEAQANTGSGWSVVDSTTITSNQNVSLDISGSSATRYRTVIESSETGSERTVTLEDEGVTFTASSPTLSNPDPPDGSDINSYDGSISIDLNDSDFSLAQGDRVTVTASDSSGQIGSQDITQNDTVSFSYSVAIGENNVTWTATDEYGNSDSLQQNFTTPQGLEIRNASNPSQLVDSAEVKIEFFNETQKITKTTDNGIVSFSGLNEQDTFVVQVNASGYTNRRVVLDSLLEQQAVYLVPENESTVDVRFSLQDNTGRFQAESTDFILRRGLNVSGDTTYKRVAGDRFGATQTLEFNLKQGARYRLVARNTRGDTRELGGVTITRAETIPVQIGALDFSIENESTYQINTSQPTQNGQRDLTLVYQDPGDKTTSLDLRIHERGNVSNTLATYSKAGTFGTIKIVEPTTDTNTSYVANVTFVRGGEEFTAVVPYGTQQYPLGAGLDQGWQSIISVGLILVVGGLFSAGNLKVGALVVPGIAGVLWFVGWMGSVATAGGIILAFGLGIGYNLIYRQGVV